MADFFGGTRALSGKGLVLMEDKPFILYSFFPKSLWENAGVF